MLGERCSMRWSARCRSNYEQMGRRPTAVAACARQLDLQGTAEDSAAGRLAQTRASVYATIQTLIEHYPCQYK